MIRTVRLSENEMKRMIAESVKRVLNEAEGMPIEQIMDLVDERLEDIKMYSHEGNFREVSKMLRKLDADLSSWV